MALHERRGFLVRGITYAGLMMSGPVFVACGSSDDDDAGIDASPPVSRGAALTGTYLAAKGKPRLAVDVWLPSQAASGQVPTALRATRYRRSTASGPEPSQNSNAEEATFWTQRGYAFVVVDALGSGASFGTRTAELSKAEIEGYGDVMTWIARQAWSNGRVGAYGTSYDGNTAEHMARLGNPYLKAVAPLFNDYDVYRGTIYPGGAFFSFFGSWAIQTQYLDGVNGAESKVAEFFGVDVETLRARVPAARAVDGPEGAALFRDAVSEHQGNVRLNEVMPLAQNRDEAIWSDLASPTYKAEIERAGIPFLVQAGWFDAATVFGTLERYATYDVAQQVSIGPWAHAGNFYDPLSDAVPNVPGSDSEAQRAELGEFFDRFVRDGQVATRTKTLRFSTAGRPGWTQTDAWPVRGTSERSFFLTDAATLVESAPPTPLRSTRLPTTQQTTGAKNIWTNQVEAQGIDYTGWLASASDRLAFTSSALAQPIWICGVPVISLGVATTGTDGVLHAYLLSIEPDGSSRKIGEGVLRLAHRGAMQPAIRTDQQLGRSFAAADRASMTPGTFVPIVFSMLAMSVQLAAGSRLQLAFASSDTDNFESYATLSDVMSVASVSASPARIVLPVLPTE
jgi:uncharacterized protein